MAVFWDSSALVHLLCDQGQTARAQLFIESQPKVIAWWGSVAECHSAVCRLERDRQLTEQQGDNARTRLAALRKGWAEVVPSEPLLQKTVRLLRTHALRTADALQLAAALVANADRVDPIGFLAFDAKLQSSASKEGLRVLTGF